VQQHPPIIPASWDVRPYRNPYRIRFTEFSWNQFSLERRWSSRRFPYGYLVTTSSQSPSSPSTT